MEIRCSCCGKTYPVETRAWRCSQCEGLFELKTVSQLKHLRIDRKNFSVWRYRSMLPSLKEQHIVSLGEGWTPLVTLHIGGRAIHGKLEYLSPTGSFKDRGTTVMISLLKKFGIEAVVEDSSGNAAASLAAYCARAQMRAMIFAPAHASPAKLAQIRMLGARLSLIVGPREFAARAAEEAAQKNYYASHVYNPFWLEGVKTYVYKMWEQFDRRAPDAIIAPAGHGSLIRAAYKAYAELLAARLVKKIPRLFAVQAETVSPLYRGWVERADERGELQRANQAYSLSGSLKVRTRSTIAEGIAVWQPPHWHSILSIIRSTKGAVVTVSEEETVQAHRQMARQGIYIEPTSATAIAGFKKLSSDINPRALVVLPLTGSGLKSSPAS
jgi:threonine synthase